MRKAYDKRLSVFYPLFHIATNYTYYLYIVYEQNDIIFKLSFDITLR